ncbi:hypothetical protein CHELA17_60279 [Chelatococcus asaccharovorans]|nr:hypothetical protein CHELA17_60279 [Chelatococcus asaccharovorans]
MKDGCRLARLATSRSAPCSCVMRSTQGAAAAWSAALVAARAARVDGWPVSKGKHGRRANRCSQNLFAHRPALRRARRMTPPDLPPEVLHRRRRWHVRRRRELLAHLLAADLVQLLLLKLLLAVVLQLALDGAILLLIVALELAIGLSKSGLSTGQNQQHARNPGESLPGNALPRAPCACRRRRKTVLLQGIHGSIPTH